MFKKTVDGVLAKFSQVVADLRTIDEQSRIEAAQITDKIADLAVARDAAVNEADRARTIADRIDALLK